MDSNPDLMGVIINLYNPQLIACCWPNMQIAELVEHCISITEVRVLNPLPGPSFQCLSFFLCM